MKLKLIEAGKFSGRKKTSEEDLAELPQEVQEQVENIFSTNHDRPAQARAQSVQRDKESYFIEYNGKSMPVHAMPPNKDLEALIEKLKSKLHY